MPIKYPYKRTCRQFVDGTYNDSGKWHYIHDKNFAESPEHYVRAFDLIQKDLLHLFNYIEPSDKNLETYSFRIYELFFRTCVEIEANFKAILRENDYGKREDRLNISDYKRVNLTHRLSSYSVFIPYWKGNHDNIRPFECFPLREDDIKSSKSTPAWYCAFTKVKHNRLQYFEEANLLNLVGSVCALVALLSSQFCREDFSPGNTLVSCGGPNDGMESAIGGYFRVKFPNDWPEEERYDFEYDSVQKPDWKILRLFEYSDFNYKE